MRWLISLLIVILLPVLVAGEDVVWSLFGEPPAVTSPAPQLTDQFHTIEEFLNAGNPARLIVLTADWCQPCRRYRNVLDQFDSSESFTADVQVINIDRHRELYRLLSGQQVIPQTIWREEGGLRRRYGEQSRQFVQDALKRLQVEQTPQQPISVTEMPQPAITSRIRVVDVYDGDTVTVELVRRARVRLLDCWAPEIRTRIATEKQRGLQARDYLKSLAEGKAGVIQIPTDQADRIGDVTSMGRILGNIWVEGVGNLSTAMVSAGHATHTKEGNK